MPAFVLNPISTFAEALSRCKSPSLRTMIVAFGGSFRRNDPGDPGAEFVEVETMAYWLERERWKRGDLFTARSLWSFQPGAASRERDF